MGNLIGTLDFAGCCCLLCCQCFLGVVGEKVSGEKMLRQCGESLLSRLWEIPMQGLFTVKRSGIFMELGKLSCCRNVSYWSFRNWQSLLVCCDWLWACIISYHDFCLLTGCIRQCCLLIVSLHPWACAIARPQNC